MILEGDALYNRCADLPANRKLRAEFVRGPKKYLFDGAFSETLIINGKKLTVIAAMSQMEETNRRSAQRFSIYADVDLYHKRTGTDDKPSASGKTEDICVDAMCLLTDADLSATDNSELTADFTLFGNKTFVLPVKILSKKPAPRGAGFRYAYVMEFDFTGHPEEKTRLGFSFLGNYVR
ncbi:MAG: hypothetical protein FWG32_03575 [Oscillospiraceae bacterium]|nr:hypothetical protein [Oscillospiraceae bacterium]